jgi:tetratricopeptide (TPR) repeat protein
MSIWNRLKRKKTPQISSITSSDEYQQLLRYIIEHPDQAVSIVSRSKAVIQRFDLNILAKQLEEAKQIQEPVSIIVDAAALASPRVAYCGGKELKYKDRISKLVLIDQNLRCFSEINRHTADALFIQNQYKESHDYYLTALHYRPRYTFIMSEQTYLTPPELAGFAWPQIQDPQTGQQVNIRLTPDLYIEGPLLTLLYARLGRCLSCLGTDQIADDAFNISQWIIERIEQYNIQIDQSLVATASFLRGQSYFDRGKYQSAITVLTQVKSMAEAGNYQQMLADAENYLHKSRTRAR